MIEVLCGLKTIILLFRACSVKFSDKYSQTYNVYNKHQGKYYSYVKNKLIFVPGKWRCVHAGNKSGDLSIAQWLILSCTQPNINCVGKICPHMGPLEALICVIITLNLSIIIHTK